MQRSLCKRLFAKIALDSYDAGMHPHHDLDPFHHHRQLIVDAQRNRRASALRRTARAQRLRRRADELEQRARQVARRTFT